MVSSCSQTSNTTEARTAFSEGTSRSEIESSVRFDSKATTRFTLSRIEYTPEEIKATWYKDEEYTKIRNQCLKQIKKLENGKVFTKDKKCLSRGLESQTRLATISKTLNRKNALDAVLDEQDDQRRLGVVDEEAIAQRYHQGTSSCQLWASTVGLRDQREAERYIK
jgi:hypothetical protein